MGYSWICDLCLPTTLPADLSFSSDFSESVVENRRNDVILCKSVPGDLEEVYGLECLIKEPTRITENSSTLLDVILTNQPDFFREGGV